ncbi:MAG: NAD(P)-dependent oxidoreductase [Syntrophales bacterium]|nr:NAD(P)-dependent oxidoreductase [Syntrophales bacterium]
MFQIVGCVGVGIMGSRMCRNLLKAGFRVVAYDLNAAALRAAGEQGISAAPDLPSLAREAEVVLLSLPTPASVLAVVEGPDGLLAHARTGAYICDASSVDPGTSRRVYEAARAGGVHALDCPVSGGPTGAEAGTLTIMVGSEAADIEAVRPVLQAIGRKIIHCGGPGSGQVAKLVNQALVAVHTAGAIEALLVGRRCGLSLDTLVTILRSSSGASWMLENHVRFKALAGNYEPGFALDLMFKDLTLFLKTATEAQVPAFIAGTVQQIYNAARAAGHGALDQTVVAQEMEKLAHVELGRLTPDV